MSSIESMKKHKAVCIARRGDRKREERQIGKKFRKNKHIRGIGALGINIGIPMG